MVDKDTGEILYNQDKILACQFTRNDRAFSLMHKVLESCVRGVRYQKRNLSLSIDFSEPLRGNSSQLPFTEDSVF